MVKEEKTMKRIITILVIFVILTLFSGVISYADSSGEYGANEVESAASVARVDRLYIQTYPEKTVYQAFELLDTTGLCVRAVYDDGTDALVSNDMLDISYRQDERLRFGDDSVTVSYGGKSVNIPVTVERIPYDLSGLAPSSFSVIYNGKFRSYTDALPSIIGLDGIPLDVKVVGGGTSVGVYSITLDFSTESRDYLIPESKNITMTILPLECELVWSECSFIYDGRSKLPAAYYTDAVGAKVFALVSGAATEAGDSYVARASVSDPNYSFKNTSTVFEIKKADYDTSGAFWSESEFVYDGTQKRVYLSGLPDGVSILGYNNDRARSAGSYTVSVRLSYDERNYNPPKIPTLTWEILPAKYDMSGVSFLPTEAIFDGRIHYPTLDGVMPTGADGIRLEYSFSRGATHVADGEVAVTVSFSTKSKNYLPPESVTATVRITPKPIFVNWSDSQLYYSGESIAPTATSSECQISVSGSGVNVGKYKATATAQNDDFLVENKDFEFEILKSENSWIEEPHAEVGYEGSGPRIVANAKFGKVKLKYFTDPECKNEIPTPTAIGVYYALAFVSDTDNYSALESKVITFELIKVVPIGLLVEINKDTLKVFDRLANSDFSAYILNNDDTTILLDSSLVTVVYQDGEYLHLSDDIITFSYENFKTELKISVSKADYDLSFVAWENASPTYDGTPKSPILIGLPDGIKVLEYIGAGVTNAGRYTVSVLIEYDREHYNEPIIPPCEFVVKKQVVPVPTVSAVYNGNEQNPMCDSTLYRLEYSGKYLLSGAYPISAILTDSKNYVFSDGSTDTCTALFEILPSTVYISVPDVAVHLWDKIEIPSYTITDGGAIGDDELVLSSYIDADRVRYRSENPNYKVVQTGGAIERLPYPSVGGVIRLILWIILIFALIGVATWCVIYRHRITNAFAAFKCRWINRNIVINPPRRVSASQPNRFQYAPKIYQDSVKQNEKTEECVSEDGNFSENEVAVQDVEPIEEIETVDDIPIESESLSVDAKRADELITDSLAKNLVRKRAEGVYTDGSSKSIINVDTLSENFSSGDKIDVNVLKSKSLVPYDTAYIKVLARGMIDKPLTVYANDFSLSAVKMIALTGGEAIKTVTLKPRDKNDTDS